MASTADGSSSTVTAQRYSGPQRRPRTPAMRNDRDVGPGGRYHLGERIGEGAMGVVYEAFDRELDRSVALKCVHPRRSRARERAGLFADLVDEARTLARLAHPNIVPVFDISTSDGEVFVAMELVEGTDLRRWVDQQRPAWPRLLAVLRGAGAGLA
ncbi:MAG: protein kinase, partial [Nannocystaceae bacterium]